MDTARGAERWVGEWERGWSELDLEPVIALYVEGAHFRSHPFRVPGLPADYVRQQFGAADRAEPWFGRPVVDGHRAAVDWRAMCVRMASM
jgi:hypothetical protein